MCKASSTVFTDRLKQTMGAVRLAHLSLFHAGAAIQAEVDVSVVVEELLQHVQHARHLSEDQHPVAPSLQLPQQSVEGLQLACAQKQRKTRHKYIRCTLLIQEIKLSYLLHKYIYATGSSNDIGLGFPPIVQ